VSDRHIYYDLVPSPIQETYNPLDLRYIILTTNYNNHPFYQTMSSDADNSGWAAPLTKSGSLVIKIFAFGAAGLVGSTLLGIIIYLLFFKKRHLERKAARTEEEVR